MCIRDRRKRAGLGDLPSSATANVEAFLDALLTERGHEMLYEGTVSYTHLDVYKRQK